MYTLAAVIDCNNGQTPGRGCNYPNRSTDAAPATHEQVEIRISRLLKYCKDGLQIEANKEVSVSKWYSFTSLSLIIVLSTKQKYF